MQDPFAGRHRCQIFLIAQRSPDNYVGTAGVERLLVQNDTTYKQEYTEREKKNFTDMLYIQWSYKYRPDLFFSFKKKDNLILCQHSVPLFLMFLFVNAALHIP